MNILICNWRDPKHPLAGGAEVSLLEHAKYWQKKGAQITWFASSFDKVKKDEIIDGIRIIRRGSHYTVHLWAFLEYLKGTFHDCEIIIDCFHFLPFFTPLYMRDKKIIALIHEVAKEIWFKNLPWVFAKIGYHLEEYFFMSYKRIPFITVSKSTQEDLEDVGVPKKNITVIHNGVRLPKFGKKARDPRPTVLFLGRIAKDKGIEDVVKAYNICYQKNKNIKLVIAGQEEKKGFLHGLLRKFKGNIESLGFVTEKKKYELMQKAWVLLHASIKEGWGLTIIEANCVGTPAIGYNVAGLRDSIQGNKTGLLVDPNPQALAIAIEKLMNDKDLYKKLCANAKEWSGKFNWEKSGKESWKVLQYVNER